MGEWVAATACRQLATWTAQGHQIPRVSINVSADQLRRTNMPALMRRLLSHYRLDATHIVLELTESALLEYVDRVQHMLRELKALGIQLRNGGNNLHSRRTTHQAMKPRSSCPAKLVSSGNT